MWAPIVDEDRLLHDTRTGARRTEQQYTTTAVVTIAQTTNVIVAIASNFVLRSSSLQGQRDGRPPGPTSPSAYCVVTDLGERKGCGSLQGCVEHLALTCAQPPGAAAREAAAMLLPLCPATGLPQNPHIQEQKPAKATSAPSILRNQHTR